MKIAVVGPLADQTKVLLGNYNGTPTHTVSVLDGMKAEFPDAQINFVPGTQFLRPRCGAGAGVRCSPRGRQAGPQGRVTRTGT